MSHQSPITGHQSPGSDIRTALREGIAQLEREHVPSAPLAAELLLMHTLGRDRTWLYAHPEQELGAEARARYFSLIAQRASGVPTQYLTGHQEFWGLDFEVTPDVLIPRPETEHVIEVALERLGVPAGAGAPRRNAALRIADVGTGSGCIAVALARELPGARVAATDISAAALEVARRNAARHSVSAHIDFIRVQPARRILPQVTPRSHSGQASVQSPVTFLRPHRQQSSLHWPRGSRDAAARSSRSRATSGALCRRDRHGHLRAVNRTGDDVAQARWDSCARTRLQLGGTCFTAARRGGMERCHDHERPGRHRARRIGATKSPRSVTALEKGISRSCGGLSPRWLLADDCFLFERLAPVWIAAASGDCPGPSPQTNIRPENLDCRQTGIFPPYGYSAEARGPTLPESLR